MRFIIFHKPDILLRQGSREEDCVNDRKNMGFNGKEIGDCAPCQPASTPEQEKRDEIQESIVRNNNGGS